MQTIDAVEMKSTISTDGLANMLQTYSIGSN